MIHRARDLAWYLADALRGAVDLTRWPFERALWAVERGAIWPLARRGVALGLSGRGVALGAGALAAGALALGVVLSGGGGTEPAPVVAAPDPEPAVAAPRPDPEPSKPVLEGAAPDFSATTGEPKSPARVADADAVIGSGPADASGSTASPTRASSSAAKGKAVDPGPAAIEVARRFSGAFVLYETGYDDARVRATLDATATPRLAKALLRRPPRQPGDAKVPKAKVLNVVPGPRRGKTFTLSASLLRVGVTSELRLDLRRDRQSGEWQVTDVLG